MNDHREETPIGLTPAAGIFRLAWPIFVSNVLGILLGFVDVYVVSKVGDLAASAISAACQVTGVCSLLFNVVCCAASILVAQNLGSGKRGRASEISALSLSINTAAGVLVSLFLLLAHGQLLTWLGAEGELLRLAKDYLGIVGASVFLEAYTGTLFCILTSHGETRRPMFLSMAMSVLNLALDMVMVLGLFGFPALGVRGAAIATVLARLLNAVLLSRLFFRLAEKPDMFRCLRRMGRADVRQLFALGVPAVFDSLNYNFSQLAVTAIIFHFLSETDIITRTYLGNIAVFFQVFTNAISQAVQILTGHMVGGGDYDAADRTCMRGLKLSALLTTLLSASACLISARLFGIFTRDPAVLALGRQLLLVNVFLELGRAVNVVLVGGLRGAGDVSVPVFIAAACMWVIEVGCTYVAVAGLGCGMLGVWLLAAFDECLRGALMLGRWRGGKWRNTRLTAG